MMESDPAILAVSADEWRLLLFWLLPATLASIHVFRDCRKLGENATLNISGTFILWPIFYLGWILWWPGSLRLFLTGRSIKELAAARNVRRLRERQGSKARRD